MYVFGISTSVSY